jgi:type II secretory pathway predicted ATPase ExeA
VEHLHHFGLSEDPFRNEPRLRDFFETPSSREVLARIERGLRQARGLVVLTGEPGSGKTMLVRRLLDTLEEEVFEASMLVVLSSGADAGWILTRFAKLLGIEEPEREREALLAQVYEQLAIIREDGRHAVLIIDDAHLIASGETLSDVCGLLKLEYEDRRLFSLVLAGDDRLEAAIAADPGLAHRVEVKARVESLGVEGVAAYLTQRIRQAGGSPSILENDVIAALQRLGRGLPGRMNTLADNALFEAFLCGRPQVSRPDVECAHRSLGWEQPEQSPAAPPAPAPQARSAPAMPAAAPPEVSFAPAMAAEAPPPPSAPATPTPAPPQPSAPAELEVLDPLESELEAVFEVASSEHSFSGSPPASTHLPMDGPPKEDEPEDLLIELLED